MENDEMLVLEGETSEMLSLMNNTFYSNKEIFFRELINNASNALDKIQSERLTDKSCLDDELTIRLVPHKANKTLSIIDTGIGMTKTDMANNLGVGFYSAYLVAHKVTVTTKHNDHDHYIWESHIGLSFTIKKDLNAQQLLRGTQITLFLKDDQVDSVWLLRLRINSVLLLHPWLDFVSLMPLWIDMMLLLPPQLDLVLLLPLEFVSVPLLPLWLDLTPLLPLWLDLAPLLLSQFDSVPLFPLQFDLVSLLPLQFKSVLFCLHDLIRYCSASATWFGITTTFVAYYRYFIAVPLLPLWLDLELLLPLWLDLVSLPPSQFNSVPWWPLSYDLVSMLPLRFDLMLVLPLRFDLVPLLSLQFKSVLFCLHDLIQYHSASATWFGITATSVAYYRYVILCSWVETCTC
ncbi:unnamed protein product [Sphenostylis stenocarpa]|uniref:Histidine kinase/HSP90-like ATPase domain-containing protein n=1 Tax=Sphenostylis stenocarpa TaxID=92480 RepID=A0AA86VQV6_9FABA|nr:unnamed protein product [Sphenostylis stenocarpa]